MIPRRRKKKDNTWSIVAAIGSILLIALVVMQQKQKPVDDKTPDTTATTEPEEPAEPFDAPSSTIEVPVVFPDPQKQKQFEVLFASYQSVFSPPVSGSPIRIFKKNGGRVEGDLLRFTASGLVLNTPDGLINVAKEDMTKESRDQLFIEEFSRSLAEQKVLSGISGTPATQLSELFLKPQSLSVVEARRFTADRLNARYGPSRRYADVPDTELFRGQTVYVVAETNAWIHIKGSEHADTTLGWVPKFSTFTLRPEDKAAITREVRTLMDNGLIIQVDPMKNEALVDTYEWQITDDAAIEGQARLLAYYCGHQRNSRLYWVDIRDALSNRRIAEYSESKGFKAY